MNDILSLTGPYKDWSNFGLRQVFAFGRIWPTSEHGFQAAKFFGVDDDYLDQIAKAKTPAEAKQLGRTREVPIRPNWDQASMGVMTVFVLRKFEQHQDLRMQLIQSYPSLIVEGNAHGDDIWGAIWEEAPTTEKDSRVRSVSKPRVWARTPDNKSILVGRNQLGQVLMLVRRELS